MTDPRIFADSLIDDQAVARAARRVAGSLHALHAFQAAPAAQLYPAEVGRLAWRAAVAVTELLEVAKAARAREEARA